MSTTLPTPQAIGGVDKRQPSAFGRIPLRMRADLDVSVMRYGGDSYYCVKDPLKLRYIRLREQEYFILTRIDGCRSLFDLHRDFAQQYPCHSLADEELTQFINQLVESGLVVIEALGRGAHLLNRADQQRRRQRSAAMTNVLYLKLPGIDPERFLQRLSQWVGWIYSPVGVLAAMALILSALVLVTVNFSELCGRPEFEQFHAFFNVYNIGWLWLALAVTRVIHEIGHGVTCTRFGGECHEMGLLFLVFSPCLYCNVSDAWMIPSKWRRIAVSAAGIYVEAVLASLATFVWWYTQPGLVHNLAFSTLFVCSVSTVLFNANPLMRFDGYYVLSDLLELPNLRSKATQLLHYYLAKWCLGINQPADPFIPPHQRWLLVLYAVCAIAYRWLVTAAILMFLYTFLKPYKLQVLGIALALAMLVLLVVVPGIRFAKFVISAKRTGQMSHQRLWGSVLVFFSITAGVLGIPVPHTVESVFTVQPSHAEAVYVAAPGTLTAVFVESGRQVHASEALAELSNDMLALECEQLKRSVELQQSAIETRWALDETGELRQAQHALADAQLQLDSCLMELQRLKLSAPRSGTVISAPSREPLATAAGEEQLVTWSGDPLRPENLGGYFEAGSLLCYIGDPNSMEAIAVVDQEHIEFVHVGQTVKLKLDALPLSVLTGTIVEVARQDIETLPAQLSTRFGGELPTQLDELGRDRALSASYQVRVRLDAAPARLLPGFRGQAKIDCGTHTIAEWLTRTWSATIRLRL